MRKVLWSVPRATRSTKVHRGNDGSAPAKRMTWLNTRALMPRAAPKDSTTVPASGSGATIARSTSPTTTSTTASTSGTTRGAVVAGGTLDVKADGAATAGLGAGPRDRMQGGAQPVHGVEGGLAVRGGGQGRLQLGVAVPDHRG